MVFDWSISKASYSGSYFGSQISTLTSDFVGSFFVDVYVGEKLPTDSECHEKGDILTSSVSIN